MDKTNMLLILREYSAESATLRRKTVCYVCAQTWKVKCVRKHLEKFLFNRPSKTGKKKKFSLTCFWVSVFWIREGGVFSLPPPSFFFSFKVVKSIKWQIFNRNILWKCLSEKQSLTMATFLLWFLFLVYLFL